VSLPDSESPADDVLTAERDQILRTAVNELDESDREVVVLKIFAGLTFDAVAEILDQPAKTVATRYRRSLMKLEERLRGQL
jgi:RNA polymerase sigma-70 factor (ECF subfamily)